MNLFVMIIFPLKFNSVLGITWYVTVDHSVPQVYHSSSSINKKMVLSRSSLIDFYNNDALPVIYTQGSLGASGDLAPLAHLSLPLLGMGEFNYNGKKASAQKVLDENKWDTAFTRSQGVLADSAAEAMAEYHES